MVGLGRAGTGGGAFGSSFPLCFCFGSPGSASGASGTFPLAASPWAERDFSPLGAPESRPGASVSCSGAPWMPFCALAGSSNFTGLK